MALNISARLALAGEHVKHDRVPAAEKELASILAQDPENASALTLLGVLYFRTERWNEAETTLESVIAKSPSHVDAVGLLAVIQKAKGNYAIAIKYFENLVELGQRTSDVYNQIGGCWLELGDAVAAGIAFKKAIELDRANPQSYFNLGLALKLAGNSYETFFTFKRVIEMAPDFLEGYVELWQSMRRLLNWSEGLPSLERGLKRFPGSTQMMVMAALTFGKVGQSDRAEELLKAAMRIDPSVGPPYAHWLQEEGRFDESIPVLKEAIRLDPAQPMAYHNLAVAKCFEIEGRSLVDWVTPLLNDEPLTPEMRMFLFYTLAKTHDYQRNYELAMRNYDEANRLAYDQFIPNYKLDQVAIDLEYDYMTEQYSKEAIGRLRKLGSTDPTPVFIVGMIRTGTTLLDQILSSHPEVKSAGEQPFWQLRAGRINRRWHESQEKPSDIRELAREYLELLKATTGGARRITDKMPTNFPHIGLMSITFPQAKFIHIRRSPMDTCLSIYTTFLGKNTSFAYNQQNIVGYYRAYLRTMEHWRSVIPSDQMIEIDYEELVTDKESVLRRVLTFCGLEWNDAVLSHESNATQVSTPSLWAVRQPVNAASVEKWRRYEPWLGQLSELRDVVHPKPANSLSAS